MLTVAQCQLVLITDQSGSYKMRAFWADTFWKEKEKMLGGEIRILIYNFSIEAKQKMEKEIMLRNLINSKVLKASDGSQRAKGSFFYDFFCSLQFGLSKNTVKAHRSLIGKLFALPLK